MTDIQQEGVNAGREGVRSDFSTPVEEVKAPRYSPVRGFSNRSFKARSLQADPSKMSTQFAPPQEKEGVRMDGARSFSNRSKLPRDVERRIDRDRARMISVEGKLNDVFRDIDTPPPDIHQVSVPPSTFSTPAITTYCVAGIVYEVALLPDTTFVVVETDTETVRLETGSRPNPMPPNEEWINPYAIECHIPRFG